MKLYPDVVVAYVRESGRIRTKHSRDTYRKVMRLLQQAFPGKPVDKFTAQDLTTFCLSRYDGKAGQAAPSTIKQRRAHIRSTWKWATWKGFVPKDVSVDLEFTVQPGKGQVRTGTWLDADQVVRMIRDMRTDDLIDRRDLMVVLTGILTGLRRFELAGLRWDNFNSDFSQLTLKGKGDKISTIGVPPELQDELKLWHKERHMGATAVFPSFKWVMNPGKGKRVRVIRWDDPLGESGITYAVERAGERLGIDLDPHDLRRTLAGLLEAQGKSLKEIQLALRHENIGTTDTYLQKNPARAVAVTKEFRLGL